MKDVLIITGGNKGLGSGIAKTYHKNGYTVFSLARSKSNAIFLKEEYQCDISNSEEIEPALKTIFSKFSKEKIKNLRLINNAGDLGIINSIENLSAKQISYPIQVNLIAPITLNAVFIKLAENLNCSKKIINISSGAAIHPYESWVTYCASKAGLDMMTKVIAKEQEEKKFPIDSISVYPGIIDTQMQKKLRNTPKTKFKNVDRFIEFYNNKQLFSPLEAAEKLFILDFDGKLTNGTIADLRN